MDLRNTILAILFLVLAILMYIFHRYWLKKTLNDTTYTKFARRARIIQNWIVIVALILFSIILLFSNL